MRFYATFNWDFTQREGEMQIAVNESDLLLPCVQQLLEGTYAINAERTQLTLLGYPKLHLVRSVAVSPGNSINTDMLAFRDAQVVTASSFVHPENLEKHKISTHSNGPCIYHYSHQSVDTVVDKSDEDSDHNAEI